MLGPIIERVVKCLGKYGELSIRELCACVNGHEFNYCRRVRCRYVYSRDRRRKTTECEIKYTYLIRILYRLQKCGIVILEKKKVHDKYFRGMDIFTIVKLNRKQWKSC